MGWSPSSRWVEDEALSNGRGSPICHAASSLLAVTIISTCMQSILHYNVYLILLYIYIAIFVYNALYLAIYLIYNISIFKAGSIELTYSILAIKSNQAANWVMCATKSTWRLWGCLALSPPWHWLKRKHQVAVTNCRAKLVLIILFRYFSVSSHRGPQIWNPSCWCSVFVKRSSLFSSVRF